MSRRGFSLIEVLIAVTVLALGLLGLAAVFPVVVGQQRDAANAVEGEIAASTVRSYLTAHEVLSDPQRGWDALDDDLGRDGREWVFLTDSGSSPAPMTWAALSGTDIQIPLSERLWPSSPAVRPSAPRFVWDIAALDTDPSLGDDENLLRVAVFVRPVDPAIRGDVWPAINGGTVAPVSEDADGVPARNGAGDYASLFGLEVEVYDYASGTAWDGEPERADAFLITALDDGRPVRQAQAALSKNGQRIVDRHGNVYRVTASKPLGPGELLLRIDPPVRTYYAGLSGFSNGFGPDAINPCVASAIAPATDPIVLEFEVQVNP